MRKRLRLLAALIWPVLGVSAQVAPSIAWEHAVGSSGYEQLEDLRPTADGGCILVGMTYGNDGDVVGSYVAPDAWVVKLTTTGALEWQKVLGGSGYDMGTSIRQTPDGGYVFAGLTNSLDGDVGVNYGGRDAWLVRLDASGNLLWERSYGGSLSDEGMSVELTNDGGYVLGCHSLSSDGDVAFNNGDDDWWVVKLDSVGDIEWQRVLGSSAADWLRGVMQTSAGDFVVHGVTQGNDGDVLGNHGGMDAWVVRLEASGAVLWQRPLGGSAYDWVFSVDETTVGDLVLGCESESDDGDVSQPIAGNDAWVVKLDANGTLLWDRSYGGSLYDGVRWLAVMPDGGCVFVGSTYSLNGDVVGNHGGGDAWVVRLDDAGALLWQKPVGGSLLEQGASVHPTADGGYLLGIRAESNDGDVSSTNGGEDFWAVKLNADDVRVEERQVNGFMLFPNPSSAELFLRFAEPINGTLVVIDASGREVLAHSIRGSECSMNVHGLQPGVYSVRVQSGAQVLREQLVVH